MPGYIKTISLKKSGCRVVNRAVLCLNVEFIDRREKAELNDQENQLTRIRAAAIMGKAFTHAPTRLSVKSSMVKGAIDSTAAAAVTLNITSILFVSILKFFLITISQTPHPPCGPFQKIVCL
jgi:hypothetical protein